MPDLQYVWNGAIAVHWTKTNTDEGIVLAHWPDRVHPWVTWMTDADGRNTMSGHYHDNLAAAYMDYVRRGGQPDRSTP